MTPWRVKVLNNDLFSSEDSPHEPVISIEKTDDGKRLIKTARRTITLSHATIPNQLYFQEGTRHVLLKQKTFYPEGRRVSEMSWGAGIKVFEPQGHAEFDDLAAFVAAAPAAVATRPA
jgi:hypothetical protein